MDNPEATRVEIASAIGDHVRSIEPAQAGSVLWGPTF
jgi:hypothetical protein